MSRFAGPSDVDAVRDATDLVQLIGEHIPLKRKGREFLGLCPFHDDHDPSMAVVTHKGSSFYKCHSCGAAGNAFNFVMEYHKKSFAEALRFLADRAGITLQRRVAEVRTEEGTSREDLHKVNAFAAMFFARTLGDPAAGEAGRGVVERRGISPEMVGAFRVGLAPDRWDALASLVSQRRLPADAFVAAGLLRQRKEGPGHVDYFRNRLMFTICDDVGQSIAFGGRQIDPEDNPKYINSPESAVFHKSRTLYGLHLAKRSIIESRQALVTEGYTDVIACHQAGVCNVVGTLGTALTRDHARTLGRLCDTVVLVFDGDEAGQKAADRAVEIFFGERVDVKICVLPDGLDPDELLKTEGGLERFHDAVGRSIDALAYKLKRFTAELHGVGSLSGRQAMLERFLAELGALGFGAIEGVRKRLVLTHLADLLGVSVTDVERAIPRRPANRVEVKNSRGDVAPTGSIAGSSAAVLPARRQAEHDLLALLLFDPMLIGEPVRTRDGALAAIADLFPADQFEDSTARLVADAAYSLAAANEELALARLLDDLPQASARELATSLYLDGERRATAPHAEPAAKQLQNVCAALESLVHRAHYHQKISAFRQKTGPEFTPLSPLEAIELRRGQGYRRGHSPRRAFVIDLKPLSLHPVRKPEHRT